MTMVDLQLPNGISSKGPKLGLEGGNHQKLVGALTVLEYVLGQISENRKQDLQDNLNKLFSRIKRENKDLTEILQKCSGLNF